MARPLVHLTCLTLVLLFMICASYGEPSKNKEEPIPSLEGMVQYKRAVYTQSIAVVNDQDSIKRIHRTWQEDKWQVNGGMEGITGYTSHLYKNDKAASVKPYIADIPVLNSFNSYQNNRGYVRNYPNGSKFVGMLSRHGVVFEMRQREKIAGEWKSTVIYENPMARPKGYTGKLPKTCSECHSEAGTGKYDDGLVPGGDGVFSDPFPALEK